MTIFEQKAYEYFEHNKKLDANLSEIKRLAIEFESLYQHGARDAASDFQRQLIPIIVNERSNDSNTSHNKWTTILEFIVHISKVVSERYRNFHSDNPCRFEMTNAVSEADAYIAEIKRQQIVVETREAKDGR